MKFYSNKALPKNKKQKNGVKNTIKKLSTLAAGMTLPGVAITAGKFVKKKMNESAKRGKAKKKKKMDIVAANRRDRAKVKG